MNTNQDQNSQSTPSGLPSQTELASTDNNPQAQQQPLDPVIFTYTRKEALADGVQVDVSTMAAEAGFKIPVFLTHSVHSEYVKVPEGVSGQDENGRLWDILWMLRYALRKTRSDVRWITFELYVRNSETRPAEKITLAAEIGALDFDKPEAAITIMLPDED